MTTSSTSGINTETCILLSHVFIRPSEIHKAQQLELAIQHYRLHNPNNYLILTGHGPVSPPPTVFDLCDFVYWNTEIIEREIGVGHPKLVNIGIDHARDKGFQWLFKCRADGVILRENVVKFCHELLGNKKILLTQQTEFAQLRAGDLFMYGSVEFLKKCWDISTWYPTNTGLTSFAKNILAACGYKAEEWVQCLLQNAAFIDVYTAKWIDLHYNWDELYYKQAGIIHNRIDGFEKYLWGTKEGGHTFDADGNMVSHISAIICEKDWKERSK